MGRKRHQVKRYKKRVKSRGEKKDATLWAVLFIVVFWYILIGRELLPTLFQRGSVEVVNEEISLYDVPCTQAHLAKLLACTLEEEEIAAPQEEVGNVEWYKPYYEALKKKGFLALDEKQALQLLDVETFNKVLSEVVGQDYKGIVSKEEEQQLSIYEVINTYELAMNQANKKAQIEYLTIAILATPSDEPLEAWQVITDQGKFNFKGLILDPLRNQTVQVALKNQEILGVMKVTSRESVIEDCTLEAVTDQMITAVIKGNTVHFINKGIDVSEVGSVGRLTLTSEGATVYEAEVYGQKDCIIKVTNHTITLEKAGVLQYKDVKFMDQTDLGNYTSIKQLPYGTQIAYQNEGDRLTALQVIGRSNKEGIRVVLASEAGGYTHETVKLVSVADYDMIYNGETTTLKAEEVWDSEHFDWQSNEQTVQLVPKGDSTIKLLTLKKNQEFPKYKGSIEITKVEGGYHIVNEVDMENYVAGVIPSEMPTSYGIEALKVQAIAARTYGAASKESSKFIAYGAQIDDTTASQVYNNIPANALAYEAAAATEGKVLKYKGNLLSSKFFATSCGYTANYGEVWATGENFPSDTPPYMIADRQYTGDEMVKDMKDEKAAYTFFKLTADDLEAFDEESPWFRWQVQLSEEEISDLVNNAIGKLSKQYPALIKVKKADEWKSEALESVGRVQDLQVDQRGEGGNVMTLIIEGSKATIKVSTEYVIRSLLAGMGNPGVIVVRNNGSTTGAMSLLPSAFFAPEITYDNQNKLEKITLYGGGFGHGVGMSQDGVRGMAEMGYSYDEILKHFYKEIEIVDYK